MTKSTIGTNCLGKFLNYLKFSFFVFCNHHLTDTVATMDCEILIRKIDENYLDFATIVGINGSRGIEYSNTGFDSKTRARTNLSLVIIRQFDVKSGRNQYPLQWFQHQILVEIGTEIHSS